jgi:hypothetical protein
MACPKDLDVEPIHAGEIARGNTISSSDASTAAVGGMWRGGDFPRTGVRCRGGLSRQRREGNISLKQTGADRLPAPQKAFFS